MLKKLLESIRPTRQVETTPTDTVVEDGFLIERTTGRLLRRELTLDDCKPYTTPFMCIVALRGLRA